jgi:hypothetical protein
VGIFREFSDTVRQAQAQAEIVDVAWLTAAAQAGNWKAVAERLERRYPERWGPPIGCRRLFSCDKSPS